MLRTILAAVFAACMLMPGGTPTQAFDGVARPVSTSTGYSADELVAAGHNFFGQTSSGLAAAISQLLSRFGQPDAYVLGEEGAGALFGGLRYGEGALQVIGTTPEPVFWQGPSFGWDFGGSGSRVMMLVYNMKSKTDLMQRFTGVDGSAYLVGGVSMTVMAGNETFVVPVRTGVGARLGVSLGYLKFTPEPTWNPF